MAGASFFIRGATFEFGLVPALTMAQWGTLISIPFILAVLAFFTTLKAVFDYLKRFL